MRIVLLEDDLTQAKLVERWLIQSGWEVILFDSGTAFRAGIAKVNPDLIIIDEPTEGLAPKIVALVGEFLQALRDKGVSVLLIEQKLTIALSISDRALVMGHGSLVFDGTPAQLREDQATRKEWLEV